MTTDRGSLLCGFYAMHTIQHFLNVHHFHLLCVVDVRQTVCDFQATFKPYLRKADTMLQCTYTSCLIAKKHATPRHTMLQIQQLQL